MRSSFYLATAKTAFLLTFGFAMSCIIAPSMAIANVIINHQILGFNNPEAEQRIDGGIVTGPLESTSGPDGLPDDSVQLSLGAEGDASGIIDSLSADDNGRIKPSNFVYVTTTRRFARSPTLDIVSEDLDQTGPAIALRAEFAPDPISVPEPGTLGLLAAAFAVLGVIRRKA